YNSVFGRSCTLENDRFTIIQGWDHVDFIGVDFLDFKRKGAELANFYTGIINDLLRVEATESKGTQLKAS
ncbi:lipase-like domain-containing protein, partial [Staphylococcus aureus]|uniref:lipase-like domain-containing protein n=5 Tax=Staphylococcus aureus TaxID=1280 RepID=UPI0020B746B9